MILLENSPDLTLEYIHSYTCKTLKIGFDEIFIKSRKRHIVVKRMIFIYLCKRLLDTPYESIGKYIANYRERIMNHSTCIHAVKTIEDLMFSDKQVCSLIEYLIEKLKEKRVYSVCVYDIDLVDECKKNNEYYKEVLLNNHLNRKSA